VIEGPCAPARALDFSIVAPAFGKNAGIARRRIRTDVRLWFP
jgi:hypothetical protein